MNLSPVDLLDSASPTGIGPALAEGTSVFATLSESLQARLRPFCDRVTLHPGERLFAAGERAHPIYFPESGAIALLWSLRSGSTIQVALIDRHAAAGQPAVDGAPLIPCDGVAQLPGTAIRLRHSALPVAMADRSFQQMIQRSLAELLVGAMQLAVCNALHRVEQRTARWLLTLGDIAGAEFPLTHDDLSTILGVRRPSITLSALILQQRGAIEYGRGHMRIRNRNVLEQSACECYASLRALQSRIRTEDI